MLGLPTLCDVTSIGSAVDSDEGEGMLGRAELKTVVSFVWPSDWLLKTNCLEIGAVALTDWLT